MDLLSKSISEIQKWNWTGPIPTIEDSSYVEFQYYNLHRKPIKDYTVEDIYFMIQQETCLDILIPIAIDLLKSDLFLEAENFPGDLLTTVLRVDNKFWDSYPKYKQELLKILENYEIERDKFEKENLLGKGANRQMTKLVVQFQKATS